MDFDLELGALAKLHITEKPVPVPIFNDEPKFPTYECYPNKTFLKKYKVIDKNILGVGSSFIGQDTLAQFKATAECIERLCLGICYNKQKFKMSRFNYTKDFLNPTFFTYKSKEFFERHKKLYKNIISSRYKWWRCFDFINKRDVYVPAQTIFLTHGFTNEARLHFESISTGAAFGKVDDLNTLKRGFLEVIERDAFITAYLTKRNVPEIIDMPIKIKELVEYVGRYNLEVKVFDITTDLKIPVFMVLIIDRTSMGPAISIGTKAGYDYQETIIETIFEALRPRAYERLKFNFGMIKKINEKHVFSIAERAAFWYPVNMIKYLNFWLKTSNKISYKNIPKYVNSFSKSIRIIKVKGYHVLIASVGVKEILKVGYDTIKVIIPELHPLYLDERAKVLYSIHAGHINNKKELKPQPFQ